MIRIELFGYHHLSQHNGSLTLSAIIDCILMFSSGRFSNLPAILIIHAKVNNVDATVVNLELDGFVTYDESVDLL